MYVPTRKPLRHLERELLRKMSQEPSGPILEPPCGFPKKVRFEKSCELCKKHGGAHTTHATKDCRKYKKDSMLKANFHAAKKAGNKPNPAEQLFAQLSKKLDKLEKTLKKAFHKSKKRSRDDSNSDSV